MEQSETTQLCNSIFLSRRRPNSISLLALKYQTLIDSSRNHSPIRLTKSSMSLSRDSLLSPVKSKVLGSGNSTSSLNEYETLVKSGAYQNRVNSIKRRQLMRIHSAPSNALDTDGTYAGESNANQHLQPLPDDGSKLTSGIAYYSPNRFVLYIGYKQTFQLNLRIAFDF